MKTSKKIITILLIIYLLLPLTVYSCPHIDADGNVYFRDHHEVDSLFLTMMYPRDNHVYTKDVFMDDRDQLIGEGFRFPVLRSIESFLQMNFFDESIFEGIDGNIMDIDVETTVRNIEYMIVDGTWFRLNVGLSNSYLESKKHIHPYYNEMFYHVDVRKVTDLDQISYERVNGMLDRRNLERIIPNAIQINAEFLLIHSTVDSFSTRSVDIFDLYDDIEVMIATDKHYGDVVAINLDRPLNSDNVIPLTYHEETSEYRFTISEGGTFALVDADFDEELFNQFFEEERIIIEREEENNTNFIWIIIVIVVISGIIIIKKTKKSEKEIIDKML